MADELAQARALNAAVGAIYFDDGSDFKKALWEVVMALAPHLVEPLQSTPSAVWHETNDAEMALRENIRKPS